MVSVIRSIDVLQCHASWRNYNFVKVCDADGNVGWSEFDEGFGSPGVGVIVRSFAPALIGYPVDRHEHIMLRLKSSTRPSQGGVVSQAIGAIENALLDAQARRLGVPCHVLLGWQGARPRSGVLESRPDVAHRPGVALRKRHHGP